MLLKKNIAIEEYIKVLNLLRLVSNMKIKIIINFIEFIDLKKIFSLKLNILYVFLKEKTFTIIYKIVNFIVK